MQITLLKHTSVIGIAQSRAKNTCVVIECGQAKVLWGDSLMFPSMVCVNRLACVICIPVIQAISEEVLARLSELNRDAWTIKPTFV